MNYVNNNSVHNLNMMMMMIIVNELIMWHATSFQTLILQVEYSASKSFISLFNYDSAAHVKVSYK